MTTFSIRLMEPCYYSMGFLTKSTTTITTTTTTMNCRTSRNLSFCLLLLFLYNTLWRQQLPTTRGTTTTTEKTKPKSDNNNNNNNLLLPSKYVALTFSAALEEFTINMLRSLEPHLIVGVHMVKVVALSPGGCDVLMKEFGKVTATTKEDDTVTMKKMIPPSWMECKVTSTDLLSTGQERNDAVTYKSKDYMSNTWKKLDVFVDTMKSVPIGSMVLFTDVDVVFFNDPFRWEVENNKNGTDIGWMRESDLWFSHGGKAGQCGSKTPTGINSGNFFVKSTTKNRDVLFQQAKVELENGNSLDGTDQGAIQVALKTLNLPYKTLPCELFANGNVYWNHRQQNLAKSIERAIKHAKIISLHANYILTSEFKKECFGMSGLWSYNNINNNKNNDEKFRFRPRPADESTKFCGKGL